MIQKSKILNRDTIIIGVLLLLTLWVRLSTQMMIHTGVDERDYWYSAKTLSQGLPYPDLTHRTVRWGVIVPVALIQMVCGIHPNVYYIAPLLNSLLQIILIYLLGKLVKNRFVGVLSTLFLIFFPYQIRAASQVRPEIFSITYILLCVYFFAKYMKCQGKKSLFFLILSSFTMFIAYETKITNLFFLPGILLSILVIRKKNAIKDCLIFGGILLALYLGETLLYTVFTDYSFGHLSIIKANHLTDMANDTTENLYGFFDLFKRYSSKNLQIYWQIPFAFFAFTSVYYLKKKTDIVLSSLIIIAVAFFFCITFSVISLKPLMVAEFFINRYFCAVLPLVFIVIAYFIDDHISHPSIISLKGLCVFSVLTMIGTTLIFALPFIPQSLQFIMHSPLKIQNHPFYITDSYYRELNTAWTEGVPIIAVDGNAGADSAMTVCWYFLDTDTYQQGKAPSPTQLIHEGKSLFVVASSDVIQGEALYDVIRKPFRIKRITPNEIPFMKEESFP